MKMKRVTVMIMMAMAMVMVMMMIAMCPDPRLRRRNLGIQRFCSRLRASSCSFATGNSKSDNNESTRHTTNNSNDELL